jgi:hypothetical protein
MKNKPTMRLHSFLPKVKHSIICSIRWESIYPKVIALYVFQVVFLLQSCGQQPNNNPNNTATDSIQMESNENSDMVYPKFQYFLSSLLFPFGEDSSFYFENIQFPFLVNGVTITRNEWKPFYQFEESEYYRLLYSDTGWISNIPDPIGPSETFVIKLKEGRILKFDFKPTKDSWKMTSIITDYQGQIPDQDFISFLIQFSKDSVFQMQHVRFPFQECLYEPGDSPNIIRITEKEWSYRDLSTEDIFFSAYLTNPNSKFRVLQARGIGCGISSFYIFERLNKKWFLIKSEDYST